MKRFALVMALGALIATVARAQDVSPAGSTYIGFKAGVVIPQHDDLEGFDNGMGLEGVVGFGVSENFAFEVGVGRLGLSGEESGLVDIGGTIYSATVGIDLTAYTVTGTAKVMVPVDKVRFFGLVGGGLYLINEDVEIDVDGYGSDSDSDSASAFAFHFGGGLDVRVAPKLTLGAELKYIIGQVETFDNKNHFDSMTVMAALNYSL